MSEHDAADHAGGRRERRIAHLDMDAFFASVELRHYPELRGRAVVVGGRTLAPETLPDGRRQFHRLSEYRGRGVVTTATYEARALGVFSGMGLMQSARLAPDAILLPGRYEAYRDYSRRFKAAVAQIAPRIEDRGIDEIYLDLSEHAEDSHRLACRLKAAVAEATGLTCSVGIAANKLLAKIASDLDKPDAITILEAGDLERRIWPLPPKKINGVGPKTAEKLSRLGIVTIGALAATPVEFLVEHFGATYGAWLFRAAHGIDERDLTIERAPKSISRETTFERDLHAKEDKAELSRRFDALCLKVAEDLSKKGFRCRTVGVKLRFADFQVMTRELTVPAGQAALSEATEIRQAAGECLRRLRFLQRIRLLGVRCGGLESRELSEETERQGELFKA